MSVSTMPAATSADAAPAPAEQKKGGLGKLVKLVGIFVVVVAVAGAAYFFLLKKDPNAPKQPGEIVTLDPQQINLAQGHYLSIGIALQMAKGAKEADGSKALDATIDTFSNKAVSDIALTEQREALKKQLVEELKKRYDGDVLGVYFTQFVTQ